MVTEEMINGKRCRRYNIAKLWVSEDGKYAAVDSIMKNCFSDVPYKRSVKIHLDNKYKGNDKLLPIQDPADINKYLKDIAILCNINKRICFHTSRHTFVR